MKFLRFCHIDIYHFGCFLHKLKITFDRGFIFRFEGHKELRVDGRVFFLFHYLSMKNTLFSHAFFIFRWTKSEKSWPIKFWHFLTLALFSLNSTLRSVTNCRTGFSLSIIYALYIIYYLLY